MTDLWQYLKTVDRPIVFYGTGDGGDKIKAELDRLGIPVAGVFASDGFVRKREYHGMPVLSYANAVKTFGEDMIVLLVFGSSLPPMLERFFSLAARHEMYVPDVPVAGGEIFNAAFYEAHKGEIEAARALLADEESRGVFDAVIQYRLTGKPAYLAQHLTDEATVMETVLHPDRYRVTLDLGAYNGDTALSLMEYAPSLQTVIALEPDEKNFTKLCRNTAGTGKVEPRYGAAWNRPEVLTFRKGGGRGIRREGKEKTVEVMGIRPDTLLEDRIPDFIKFDVEGAERQAIEGCSESIRKYTPELQVALYHRSEDIFALPLMIHDMNPKYRFYMRRYPYVPAWDLNLFCTEETT
jgi:FkbM family methyltransferase